MRTITDMLWAIVRCPSVDLDTRLHALQLRCNLMMLRS